MKRAYRSLVTKELIVHLRSSDQSIKGLLWDDRGPLLVLRNASLLTSPGEVLSMDGEIVIERSNIEFLQVVD